MKLLFALRNRTGHYFGGYAFLILWTLCLCSGNEALARSATSPSNPDSVFSARVTHLLGMPNTKHNCTGTLSIEENALQFQESGKPAVRLGMSSLLNFSLGDESKQVGGLPMKIGKAATPYGGGRVVSLFAHKKYDTLTLEYVDSNGGIHGAVFQLTKGQGELVRNELVPRGVSPISDQEQITKQSPSEVIHEQM